MSATYVLPLTKTTGFGQLPELIERGMGAPTLQKVFSKPNLSLAIIGHRKTRVPVQTVFDLFDNSGRITGNKTFDMSLGNLERVNFTRALSRW